ncbi:SDR family oxidoreductase [Microbacterium sp. YY-01]|uniref:SDR family oxidoreductase n=1 Tax=Microbacterium sp. YY-01 TaxID=3421634 RepID=UPI003D1659E0
MPQSDPNRPVALVTGGTGGIGSAIARSLASTHYVLAIGRKVSKLADLASTPHIEPVALDLLDLEATCSYISQLSRLDVLVHSAAVSDRFTVEEADAAEWRHQLELNVVVPAELSRVALPLLRASQGQLVFINSGAGLRSYPTHTLYSATKFALKALADGLRGEEREHGVRVATVHPGPTDTPMLAGDLRKADREYESEKYIQPDSIASTVRLIVDATADAQITDIVVRPRLE